MTTGTAAPASGQVYPKSESGDPAVKRRIRFTAEADPSGLPVPGPCVILE